MEVSGTVEQSPRWSAILAQLLFVKADLEVSPGQPLGMPRWQRAWLWDRVDLAQSDWQKAEDLAWALRLAGQWSDAP